MRNRINLIGAIAWFHLASLDFTLNMLGTIHVSYWVIALQATVAAIYIRLAWQTAGLVDWTEKEAKRIVQEQLEKEKNNGPSN